MAIILSLARVRGHRVHSGRNVGTAPLALDRPVAGVRPSQVGIGWAPASDTNPIIQDFIQCCLDARSPRQRNAT